MQFVKEEEKTGEVQAGVRHVGFTFSFPVKQTGIASGRSPRGLPLPLC